MPCGIQRVVSGNVPDHSAIGVCTMIKFALDARIPRYHVYVSRYPHYHIITVMAVVYVGHDAHCNLIESALCLVIGII